MVVDKFVADRCTMGEVQFESVSTLFEAWLKWRGEYAPRYPTRTVQGFARELRRVVPDIRVRQFRDFTGKQVRHYEGIGLRDRPLTKT